MGLGLLVGQNGIDQGLSVVKVGLDVVLGDDSFVLRVGLDVSVEDG